MTRDEAVAYVKHLLFEESSTQALASDANLALTVNQANTKAWLDSVEANTKFWSVTSPGIAVQGSETSLAAFGANGVHLIRGVQIRYGNAWLGIPEVAPQDGGDTEPIAGAYVDVAAATAYYIEGDNLFLYPKTEGTTEVRIKYVPRLAALTGPGELMGGRLADFHSLVVYDSAIELGAKDEARTDEWKVRRSEIGSRLLRYMRSRTRGGPPYIRVTDA
jgi:hypothetical protein